MQVTGFSHVTINVTTLARSLPFYSGLLGMVIVHQGEHDAYLTWGDAWLCLQEGVEAGTRQPGCGVDHLAFRIAAEGFAAAVALLKRAHVPIVREPVQRGAGWSVNFLDPDGTQLELHTSTLEERMLVWQ